MRASNEFFVGILERGESAAVSSEDFAGPHGKMLREWQRLGVVDAEPGTNLAATCPHCEDGTPYRLGQDLVCNRCRSRIGPRELLLWRVSLPGFLRWVARQWKLQGGVRRIDGSLWQLGTWSAPEGVYECFYRGNGVLSEAGTARLSAFHRCIVISGRGLVDREKQEGRLHLTLLEFLRSGEALTLANPAEFTAGSPTVRFDGHSGALWAGDALLGEVPAGSKEYFFLESLARNLDRFVPYADLKRHVLRNAGSRDTTEEATFCQNLKSRIKKRWIPQIDRFIVPDQKGGGYRLRGQPVPS